MKLASLRDDREHSNRDGILVVVDKALKRAVRVPEVAATFQQAIDNWSECSSKLQTVYDKLNANKLSVAFDFNIAQLASPMPRAYQWVDGSAYVNHVELVRKARGAEMPPSFWTDPLMYQGASDSFIGPEEPIYMESEEWGIDFEAEVAVVTDDVTMGISAEEAPQHIKLLMLVNDVSLRNLIPAELAKGFGFLHGKPTTSFSPVAVTPDELGSAWKDNKVHLPLYSYLNGEVFGKPNAGVDMTFDFAKLIAHAAKTRNLCAGTIVGSGTVSNLDRTLGSSCIAERRMLEKIDQGDSKTSFMKFGDRIKIEMLDAAGNSIFGAIHQEVRKI